MTALAANLTETSDGAQAPAVASLHARRLALSAAKEQRSALADLCRRQLAEHEEAIAAIDREIDLVDDTLFARGAAGEVPRG